MEPPLPSLRGKRGVRPACDEAIQKQSVRFIAKSGRRRSGLPRFARKDGGWIAAQFDRLSMTIQYNQLKARQRERGLFARTERSHRMRSEPFPTNFHFLFSNLHHARAATWGRPYGRVFISRICPLSSALLSGNLGLIRACGCRDPSTSRAATRCAQDDELCPLPSHLCLLAH